MITLKPRSDSPARPELLDVLEKCHGRMREFSGLAVRLAAAKDAPAEEIADAARSVHRYFTVAFPLHGEDEEKSLLPRLRGADAAVDEALARIEPEHRILDALVEKVVGICARLKDEPRAHDAVRGELEPAAEALAARLSEHLALEEASFFPAIERLLVPVHGATILAEMRARRDASAA